MNTRKLKVGLTLIDMIVAVAIIAVLASIVITALTRIDSMSQEKLCNGIMHTLNVALQQYKDYKLECRIDITTESRFDEREFYRALEFPPDCNGYSIAEVELEISEFRDIAPVVITPSDKHDPNESSCAVMYFFLNMVPECRETLDDIDKAFLKSDHKIAPASKKYDEDYLQITVDNRIYPWIRVIDPWGTTLRYDYYDEEELDFSQRQETIRNFPLITSAGPDGLFDTDDDITNREKTEPATYQP
jgi:type II secretory pathway pseudopilin PulG